MSREESGDTAKRPRDTSRAWEGCDEVFKENVENKILGDVQSMAFRQDEFHLRQIHSASTKHLSENSFLF